MKRKSDTRFSPAGRYMSDASGERSVWVITAYLVRLIHWGLPDGPEERFSNEPAARAYDAWLRQGIEMAYAAR